MALRAPGTLQDPHTPSTWGVPRRRRSVPCPSSHPQPHSAHRPPPAEHPPIRPWPQPCLSLPGASPGHGEGRGLGTACPRHGPRLRSAWLLAAAVCRARCNFPLFTSQLAGCPSWAVLCLPAVQSLQHQVGAMGPELRWPGRPGLRNHGTRAAVPMGEWCHGAVWGWGQGRGWGEDGDGDEPYPELWSHASQGSP